MEWKENLLIKKDPEAVKDYQIDWSDSGNGWLGSDTISSSLFTVGAGLTIDSQSNTTTTATVWLSGGTAGQKYKVNCHIVTAAGREDDRSFDILVEDH